jgi:hypothetical protein
LVVRKRAILSISILRGTSLDSGSPNDRRPSEPTKPWRVASEAALSGQALGLK